MPVTADCVKRVEPRSSASVRGSGCCAVAHAAKTISSSAETALRAKIGRSGWGAACAADPVAVVETPEVKIRGKLTFRRMNTESIYTPRGGARFPRGQVLCGACENMLSPGSKSGCLWPGGLLGFCASKLPLPVSKGSPSYERRRGREPATFPVQPGHRLEA